MNNNLRRNVLRLVLNDFKNKILKIIKTALFNKNFELILRTIDRGYVGNRSPMPIISLKNIIARFLFLFEALIMSPRVKRLLKSCRAFPIPELSSSIKKARSDQSSSWKATASATLPRRSWMPPRPRNPKDSCQSQRWSISSRRGSRFGWNYIGRDIKAS